MPWQWSRASHRWKKLLKALLGRTFIASDLATATAQVQNGHAGCDFVTLTGDFAEPARHFTPAVI